MARQKRPKLYEPAPMCDGKRRYNSEQEAERIKAEQELLFHALQLKTYRCISCGGWHLTRTKQ